MFIKMNVPECDFTDTKYDCLVAGAGAVSRGATGRWCVVMYAGPEYIESNNIDAMDIDAARKQIDATPGDWADF